MTHPARPDLGAFAAEALFGPDRYIRQRIELASDAPTPAAMAAALGAAPGQKVRYADMPLAAIGHPDIRATWTSLQC
ncbi:hypothetical protein [Streptomyces sp. NPDC101234]|uniref:hypothetical protein n=1 Tax=Streptomyces sp. NPDC101234 TaxID=3366138 RepID=UPI0037FF2240